MSAFHNLLDHTTSKFSHNWLVIYQNDCVVIVYALKPCAKVKLNLDPKINQMIGHQFRLRKFPDCLWWNKLPIWEWITISSLKLKKYYPYGIFAISYESYEFGMNFDWPNRLLEGEIRDCIIFFRGFKNLFICLSIFLVLGIFGPALPWYYIHFYRSIPTDLKNCNTSRTKICTTVNKKQVSRSRMIFYGILVKSFASPTSYVFNEP